MNSTKTLKTTVFALSVLLAISLVFNLIKFAGTSTVNDPSCPDYSTYPMSTLSVSLIHDMVDVYKNNQAVAIENQLGGLVDPHKATRNIVFDLPSLKQFIYQIESETKKQAAANNFTVNVEDIGFRFYYSAYPKDTTNWGKTEYNGNLDDLRVNHKNYAGQHTLLLVPTINIGSDKKPADFNPLDFDTYQNGIFGVGDALTRSGYTYLPGSASQIPSLGGRSATSTSNTISKNHGSLFPPETGRTLATFD